MNCANHPETPAAAYCRECGKPMCEECHQPAFGSVYCAEHLPATVSTSAPPIYADYPPAPAPAGFLPPPPGTQSGATPHDASSPYTAPAYVPPPDHGPNPAVAFGLGFIPGVGAIYNGQYAKGLIHAIIFGLLVSVASTAHGPLEPLTGIGIAVWVFYMAFEAYHTARNRRYGLKVEEFPGLFESNRTQSRIPGGPLILIGLGALLLLDTTGVISFDELDRYWPAGLIVFGVYLLYSRLHAAGPQNSPGAGPHARSEAGQ